MRRLRLLAVLGLLLVAACVPAGTGDAREAAADFQHRVAVQDWNGACSLLSDRARGQLEATAAQPCPPGLAALQLPAASVDTIEVWGHGAIARSADEALFLARFPAGWRVVAAGCTSRGQNQPYACSVRG